MISDNVFIVHGWAFDTNRWSDFIEELSLRGIKSEMLNVPGLTAPLSEPWDIGDYVSWLKAKVEKSAPAIIIGHSNGGRISLHLAAEYPHLVRKLILIDSAGIPTRSKLAKLKVKTLNTTAKLGKKLTSSIVARKLLYKIARQRDYIDAPENMRVVMTNMLTSDKSFNPASVKVPVSLIWGSDDKITPLDMGMELNRTISGSDLDVVKGGRHSPFSTHARETADLVVKALEK